MENQNPRIMRRHAYREKKRQIRFECHNLYKKNKKARGQEQGQPTEQSTKACFVQAHNSRKLLVVFDGESICFDDWVLDYACTCHISQCYD